MKEGVQARNSTIDVCMCGVWRVSEAKATAPVLSLYTGYYESHVQLDGNPQPTPLNPPKTRTFARLRAPATEGEDLGGVRPRV